MTDGMSLREYQRLSERTMCIERGPSALLPNFAMGLAGETGELVDLLKKNLFHGHKLELAKAEKELGDVLFYVAGICSVLGLQLDVVAAANVEKLRQRYPSGFTQEASINRVDP
jgi:NTP pyrophosphatase (non-canonical NTP hydrolase)